MQKRGILSQWEWPGPYLYGMGKYIFLGFMLYLLYKLVFNFILPVSRATSQVRSQIKEMQREQMRQQEAQAAHAARPTPAPQATVSRKEEDYLDFEEVK